MDSKHNGAVLDTVDKSTVIDCVNCGFAHVMPLPDTEASKKFYDKEFYDTEKPDYFKYAEEDMEWWMATYNHYYDLLEAHTKGRRLLDIGSGPGYFLDAGRERGWDVVGFEPSVAAVEYSTKRGLSVVHDVFTIESAVSYGLFDAVVLSMVLEHVPDPIRLLEDAKASLAPGGLILIIVPNDYNPLQKLLRTHLGFKPWWVVPTHHLNYFTVQSLAALLETQGFSPLETETSYPMELFLLSGRNYVGNPDVGRACHKERKTFEMALFSGDKVLLQKMYSGWAKEGIGREVVLVARRKD